MIRSKIQYIYYITVSAAWLASNKNLFLVKSTLTGPIQQRKVFPRSQEKIFLKDREDCLTRVCRGKYKVSTVYNYIYVHSTVQCTVQYSRPSDTDNHLCKM